MSARCLSRSIKPGNLRNMLCDCPWKVRLKRQVNDLWILTNLINPLAYPENRAVTGEARETMFGLVQHSSASLTTIASVLITTYRLSLFGRDALRDHVYIYLVNVAEDNILASLFFCKPDDVQNARLFAGSLELYDQ
ncbi:hypothetical protein POJ06DRAFT_284121 [Lipomyces tetrasporus]|uniref:Uncharacterized protein n=1 Tax=Lipomyces tetrasporus TaxID=54092 RepID=A0AAD7QKD5_9ASCO|nr:uncharacterized protein POJ06DRAFT_284121 [Lipomyces tetrasporus]KAJ8096471.1 hypothetical protein POJ06DRAFT_284121 [Lipomyces tetrasporus]